MFNRQQAQLPVSFEEWEYRARQKLADGPFDYIAGGAGAEYTMRANREAFEQWKMEPRVLMDVSKREMTVSLFGQTFPSPLLLAPISVQSVAHPDAELGSAKAAAAMGVPFILSTVSSRSMEEVAAVMGNSPRWFQFFWPNDSEVAASMLRRAEAAGYTAIVLTVDLPVLGWRERDIRNGFNPFLKGEGIANYTSDPVFRAKLQKSSANNLQGAINMFAGIFFNPGLTWKDLPFLRKHTKLPVLLKGIVHPADAEMALHHGIDGLIVSNHGGRQLDGEVAAIDMLPKVCDVVRGRIPVLMDSGIRRGADVVKALALGAKAVLLGRPYIYGLAVAGEQGVRQVIENLTADLDTTLALTGKKSVSELDRSLIKRVKGEMY